MTDFLTVKEFAAKANVSVQAVYQRIDRDLKPYLKIVKGKKCLFVEGLQLFVKDDSTSIKQALNKITSNSFKENVETTDNATIEILNKTLKVLQEQLKEKDKQISDFALLLKSEQEQSAQLNTQIKNLNAERQTTLAKLFTTQEKNEALQLELNKYKAIAESKQTVVEVDTVKEQAPAEDQTQPIPTEQPQQEPEETPIKKLSFFQRLFRKNNG